MIPNLLKISISSPKNNPDSIDIHFVTAFPLSERAIKLLDYLDIKYNYSVIIKDNKFNQISNETFIFTFR